MRLDAERLVFIPVKPAVEVDGGLAARAGEIVVVDAQREAVVVGAGGDGRVEHGQGAGPQFGAEEVGEEGVAPVVETQLDVAQVVLFEGDALRAEAPVQDAVVRDAQGEVGAGGDEGAGREARQQFAGVAEVQVHLVVAAAVGGEFVGEQFGQLAAQGDFFQVFGEVRDGTVAAEAALEEVGGQVDLLPVAVGSRVHPDVAEAVRAGLVHQAEVGDPDVAVEALAGPDHVGMKAGGDAGQFASCIETEGRQIGLGDTAVQAVACLPATGLEVRQAAQIQPQQGIGALDAAFRHAVVQRADDVDVAEVVAERADFLDVQGVDMGVRQAGAEDGAQAGPDGGGTQDVHAQHVAEVQLAGVQVERHLDGARGIHSVAQLAQEREFAAGALHQDVQVEVVEGALGRGLDGERNVVGDAAQVRRRFVRGQAAEEMGDGGGRSGQIRQPGVQLRKFQVGQSRDTGVRGGGQAGSGLREDQALDVQVVDVAVHVATPDVQDQRAAVEGAAEVGDGLQADGGALQLRFDAYPVNEVGHIREGAVAQGEGAHAQVGPVVAQEDVLEEGAVHEPEFDAGGELFDDVTGAFLGRQAVDEAGDLGVGHAEAVDDQVQAEVQVVEVDADPLVGALVREKTVHPETEVLDSQLLDVEEVVPARRISVWFQVEDAGQVVLVFLARFSDEVEAAALDGHAPQVQAFPAEDAAEAEGGRDGLGLEDGVGRPPAALVFVLEVGHAVDQLDVADHENARGHDLELVVLHAAVHDGGELIQSDFGQAGLDHRRLNGNDECHQQHCQQADNARDDISRFPVHGICNLQIYEFLRAFLLSLPGNSIANGRHHSRHRIFLRRHLGGRHP